MLSFALAFNERAATAAPLAGFCLMLALDNASGP